MKTSLGLFYIQSLQTDPFHLNLTHWTFKRPYQVSKWTDAFFTKLISQDTAKLIASYLQKQLARWQKPHYNEFKPFL